MMEWRKICCPVDFSDASREAMRAAVDVARQHHAELVLFHVYQLPGVSFPEASAFAGPDAIRDVLELVERALKEWKNEAVQAGAERVTTHAAMGVPYHEIVRFAQTNDCDLIVMGTHGRTALARALLGSVAEKVVRHAPCPVLTIRPSGAKRHAGFEAQAPT